MSKYKIRECVFPSVNDALGGLMEETNLTEAEFARRVGCSRAYISRLNRRQRELPFEVFYSWCLKFSFEPEIHVHPRGRRIKTK